MFATSTTTACGVSTSSRLAARRRRRRSSHPNPNPTNRSTQCRQGEDDYHYDCCDRTATVCRASCSTTTSASTRMMRRRSVLARTAFGENRKTTRGTTRCASASEGGGGRANRELSSGTTGKILFHHGKRRRRDGSGGKSRMKKVVVKSSSSTTTAAPVDASTTAQLWWRACKLPMYSVAWVPLACGAALAYCQFGAVNARQIAQLFLGSSLVIAWLNLTNDAFDSTTRVDESKPESVVRLLGGNARLVHAIAWSALAGGAALIGQACVASGSATSWRALVVAVMLGYAYQGPPFRLSYKGLGEPICFTAFGPLATVAFYLACASRVAGPGVVLTVPAVVSSVAVLVGCTTAFILFTSHFHQEDGDRAAGKLSPVVRLGLPGALLLADNLVGAHYAMIATLAAAGWLPYTAVFGLVITYPLARHVVDYAQKKYDDGEIDKLFFTKYLAVRYHVVHGVLLALGVVAQRLFLSPSLFFP